MVTACASASGGVMFIPDEIERHVQKISEKISNDNGAEEDT